MADDLILTGNQALTEADFDSLIEQWLDYEYKMNDASSNTVKTYHRGIKIFRAWLVGQGLNLGTVTPMDVLEFKSQQAAQYSVQTVNLWLVSIRSFYRWAVTTGRTPFNPASEVKGVKRKKSRSHKRDALANGEVSSVLSQPDTGTLAGLRDKAILSLLAYGALRQVEIHRANIGDLKNRGDRLALDVSGKGDKDNEQGDYIIIPLSQEPVIREWLTRRMQFSNHSADDPLFISLSNRTKGKRFGLSSIRKMVKNYYKAAGVVNLESKSTHSLRHSAITNAIRRGASPMQVKSMARHQSFDTTLGYFHEVDREDNPAEDLINYENGVSDGGT